MSNLIRKPSELEAKKAISVLIYGQAGVGKTTLGCSAPNPVLFDYDGGVNRINGAHLVPTVQIRSWEDTAEAIKEIRETMPGVKSIVIDTVGKMLDFISESIIRNDSRMGDRNGNLTLKGYGVRKTIFSNFVQRMTISGYNIIFLAHEKEEKQGDVTVKRPETGSAGNFNDLVREMDLVGYFQMIGKNRTLCWAPTEVFYAKNTCNLPAEDTLPVVVDANGTATGTNDYLTNVIKRYHEIQAEKREISAEYDKLLAAIDTAVSAVKDAAGLNELCDSVKGQKHIYDSKIKAGQKIAAKAKELNLKLNEDKRYVPAA